MREKNRNDISQINKYTSWAGDGESPDGNTYYAANLMNFRSSETRFPRLDVETISVTVQY